MKYEEKEKHYSRMQAFVFLCVSHCFAIQLDIKMFSIVRTNGRN